MDEQLDPMPEPTVQEPVLQPGGVDAVPEDPADEGLSRDLHPDHNPGDEQIPDEITEPDDKSQGPDGDPTSTDQDEPEPPA